MFIHHVFFYMAPDATDADRSSSGISVCRLPPTAMSSNGGTPGRGFPFSPTVPPRQCIRHTLFTSNSSRTTTTSGQGLLCTIHCNHDAILDFISVLSSYGIACFLCATQTGRYFHQPDGYSAAIAARYPGVGNTRLVCECHLLLDRRETTSVCCR